MKVGIGASSDVQATVDRCRKLGVECVYIGSLAGYEDNGYPDADSLRELKGRLEDNGLEVPSVTYHFARWPSRPWRTERSMNPDILLTRDRRCIDAMLRTLEVLGEVGITSVLHYVSLGKPMNPAQEEACWEGLIDIYRELIPVAEANGVHIANHSLHRILPDDVREWAVSADVRIEDYGDFRSDAWGGPFLVGTWKELRRLINAVPSPSNGVALCTGMDIPGGDVPALVAEFADKIRFCQLRDHSERWPAGREVPLGEGRVNLRAVVGALREVGYQGILNPEHLGKPRYPGEDLVAKAVAYIKSLIAA